MVRPIPNFAEKAEYLNNLPQPPGSAAHKRFPVLWVLFFFQYAAIGVYFTFLNIYYKEIGLTSTQIGLMSMVGSAVGMGGSFLWGYASDRSGRPNRLIAFGALGGLLAAQCIPLVQALNLANPFFCYALIASVTSLMISAPGTLVDSTSIAMLGERANDYGRYRLAGTIGYILTTISAGYILERSGLVWIFPGYALMMFVFALAALRLPRRGVRLAGAGWGKIGQMLRSPALLLLATTVFLFWIAFNASIMFFGVALKAMGASTALISYASVIGAVIEIPFMALSGRMIQRFGPVRLLWFAILLQVIRFFLLSRMTDPVWAVAINMLNGPGFVLFFNSLLNYISRLAPPSLLATAQGFFSSIAGLSAILSSLISGLLLDGFGPAGLFLALSGICLAALLLFGLGTRLRPAPEKVPEAGA
jgi:MFS transporter, PPP family, 3-phenylpropionic acid transporter